MVAGWCTGRTCKDQQPLPTAGTPLIVSASRPVRCQGSQIVDSSHSLRLSGCPGGMAPEAPCSPFCVTSRLVLQWEKPGLTAEGASTGRSTRQKSPSFPNRLGPFWGHCPRELNAGQEACNMEDLEFLGNAAAEERTKCQGQGREGLTRRETGFHGADGGTRLTAGVATGKCRWPHFQLPCGLSPRPPLPLVLFTPGSRPSCPVTLIVAETALIRFSVCSSRDCPATPSRPASLSRPCCVFLRGRGTPWHCVYEWAGGIHSMGACVYTAGSD